MSAFFDMQQIEFIASQMRAQRDLIGEGDDLIDQLSMHIPSRKLKNRHLLSPSPAAVNPAPGAGYRERTHLGGLRLSVLPDATCGTWAPPRVWRPLAYLLRQHDPSHLLRCGNPRSHRRQSTIA